LPDGRQLGALEWAEVTFDSPDARTWIVREVGGRGCSFRVDLTRRASPPEVGKPKGRLQFLKDEIEAYAARGGQVNPAGENPLDAGEPDFPIIEWTEDFE
jgi:hypothetical protein